MPLNNSWLLTLRGGERLVVPATLEIFSTYVFLEQEDWYEAEAEFVRRLCQPGYKVLDIGANYGFFAVAAAGRVGGAGHVWAIEPDIGVSAFLRETLSANRLDNVTVLDCALGEAPAMAGLASIGSPEFNTVQTGLASGDKITEVKRLDDIADEAGMRGVDFVKLDTEGMEGAIMRGARQFFARESPLVMAELRHPGGVQVDLLETFKQLGYRLWRYAPGLARLVPLSGDSTDTSAANVFAGKPDRAAALAHDDLLIERVEATSVECRGSFERFYRSLPAGRRVLEAAPHLAVWFEDVRVADYRSALDMYAAARDEALPPGTRCRLLLNCHAALDDLCAGDASYSRLLSLARVSHDLGLEMHYCTVLGSLVEGMRRGQAMSLAEPFLPLEARFEAPPHGANPAACAQAMILESYGWAKYGSSYNHRDFFQIINHIIGLGLGTPRLERARQLCRIAWGLQAAPEMTPLLASDPSATLNLEYWRNASA